MELSGSAHPRLVHRLLQLGEFAREVDAEPPLHVLLNVGGIHLTLDMRPGDAAQVQADGQSEDEKDLVEGEEQAGEGRRRAG